MHHVNFIGTWKLISVILQTKNDDTIYPLGENPFGRLMYDANGNVSVFLMKTGRTKFASDDLMEGSPEEIEEAFQGFDAYCGTYEIDSEKETVIHHIQGSRLPNREGSSHLRFFKLTEKRLTLKTPSVMLKGEEGAATLVWERIA